jgi:DNA-binding transcriptional ArsR family regulator
MMAAKTKRRTTTENLIKAMSHPTRSEILAILSEGQASPMEISRRTGIKVWNINSHMKVLLKLGCVEEVAQRPVRGATEHFYRAIVRPLVDTEDWEQLPEAIRKSFVGEIAQKQLDDCTAALGAGTLGESHDFHLTRTRLSFDREGKSEALEITERARLELLEAQARSDQRRAESGEEGLPVSSLLGCFELPS